MNPHSGLVTLSLSALAGVIGAVFGAFTVHRFTRARDHENWLRDSNIAEWKELLSVLTNSYLVMKSCLSKEQNHRLSADQVHEWNEASFHAARTIADRIFIADKIEQLGISNLWFGTMNDRSAIPEDFRSAFEIIRSKIIMRAIE